MKIFSEDAPMHNSFKLYGLAAVLLLGLALSWLSACGNNAPVLGQPGQPTLVFIYTDG